MSSIRSIALMRHCRSNLYKFVIDCFSQKARLSVCCCTFKEYSGREAKFMNKLMNNQSNKKKYYVDERPSKSVQSFLNDPASKRRAPMRVAVLNKLFMTYISDILATGEVSSDLIGRGMEITSVSVNIDYQVIKVYWVAKSREDEMWLESSLVQISHSLRHELSQLHLVGSVPRIQFFLDQRHSKLASVDALINSCDKGADFDISNPSQSEGLANEDRVPPMPMNVYGLKYDLIASKLIKAIGKAKAPHRKKDIPPPNLNKTHSNSKDNPSKYNQKDSIRRFLLQKRLNQEKIRKDKNVLGTYDTGTETFDTEEISEEDFDSQKYNESFK